MATSQKFFGGQLTPLTPPPACMPMLKANLLLDDQAKEALLFLQFMRGFPRNLKIRMLENDPTPTLANMVAFVQWYRTVRGQGCSKDYCDVAESSVSPQDKKIDKLVTMVNTIACKQQKLEECLTAAVNQNSQQVIQPNVTRWKRRNKQPVVCCNCGKLGHIAKDCKQDESKLIQCFSCRGYIRTHVSQLDNQIPTHPFVTCSHVYTIMDFNDIRIDKSYLEKCRYITGGSLDISGRIKGNMKFPSSKQMYSCNFLISNNIQYDCVLGWDFLVTNKLDLSWGTSEENRCYLLSGRHGKTRVCAKQPSPDIDDVNWTHETTSEIPRFGSEKESIYLFESWIKSPANVTLVKDVIIPGRTEFMLEGQLENKIACKTGIISSRVELDQSHIHVTNIAVSPEDRQVPIRVMNSSKGCYFN